LFLEAMRSASFSLGSGLAVPHTELEGVSETFVCLAITAEPLALATMDGRRPDIFLFILSKPDPKSHLLLLAHLARLTGSRTLLDGLRRARTTDEAMALVRAAEMRHAPTRTGSLIPSYESLVFVSVRGEKLVDALLVELVDQGFDDAYVLDAQSLREAATREVPLFVGFQDLFGDPGGHRLIIVEAAVEGAHEIIETVQRVSEEYGATNASVSVVPVHTRWVRPSRASDAAPSRRP
jgi:mannitol/fructose-specific phosphotransferase system IIA component